MSWFLLNRNLTPLEPYDWKLSRTVLRGERGSNAPDLPGKELKDDPKFLLVTISREESAETVTRYWKDNRFTMPFYLDPKRSAFELFANNTIPRIYIIGPDTKVVWMSVESLDLSAKELIQKIKGLK